MRRAQDYAPEMRHVGWSMTKSVWTTLFGIAEAQGYVQRHDLVTKFFPEKKGTPWEEVTLEDLSAMTSGVRSYEGYQTSPFRSDIVAALYRFPHYLAKGSF